MIVYLIGSSALAVGVFRQLRQPGCMGNAKRNQESLAVNAHEDPAEECSSVQEQSGRCVRLHGLSMRLRALPGRSRCSSSWAEEVTSQDRCFNPLSRAAAFLSI